MNYFKWLIILLQIIMILSLILLSVQVIKIALLKKSRSKKRTKKIKKKKQSLKSRAIFFGVVSMLSISALYISEDYYRGYLMPSEVEHLGEGAYLLDELEKELRQEDTSVTFDKQQKNLTNLSTQLSQFTTYYATGNLSTSKQLHINNYYRQLEELSYSLSGDTSELFGTTLKSEFYLDKLQELSKKQDDLFKELKLEKVIRKSNVL